MPKIIANVREKLIAQARKQVLAGKYSSMTVRSVAQACGVSVGTVYNYFSSKEVLVAHALLEDWQKCLSAMGEACSRTQEPKAVLYGVWTQVEGFCGKYAPVFRDPKASTAASGTVGSKHSLLRGQLADMIRPICRARARAYTPLLPEFTAEALLAWVTAGEDFENVYSILGQLFITEKERIV